MKRRFFLLFSMILLMGVTAVSVSAAEYSIDDITPGQSLELHAGDIIHGSDTTYFTIIDAVGNYWNQPSNANPSGDTVQVIIETGDQKRPCTLFGKNSSFKVDGVVGFYTIPVNVDDSLSTFYEADNTPHQGIAMLLSQPADPITYTIHYDANGGEGTIDSQDWTFLTEEQYLSNGEGFYRDGYRLTGWAIAPAGDKDGNGVIDDADEILTDALGGGLMPGPELTFARLIPQYAESLGNGAAEITLYALWAENSGEGVATPEVLDEDNDGKNTNESTPTDQTKKEPLKKAEEPSKPSQQEDNQQKEKN